MNSASDGSRRSPEHTLRIPVLNDEVTVYRDEWGIPHIRARGVRDVFVAQGFVTAQDRLWQMDASRRQMQGRWAEWVGAEGVPADMLARRLGAASASIRDYEALDDAARDMVDAYADGVNAWLGQLDALPVEYALLDGPPEPWEPWHCIAVMRHRGFLMGSVWFKLWRAAAASTIAFEDVLTLRQDLGAVDAATQPLNADLVRLLADLTDLQPAIDALRLLAPDDSAGGGSNNWAITGARTSTGRPLLAGDPHRAFELPGMYAQVHIACDEFDAIGLAVPGVPAFPHFAHNGKVAWCVTHAFADIHDLFVEHFDPDDPSRYLHRSAWLTAVTRTEQIHVRDSPTVSVEIVETIHGPVVIGSPADGAAMTLQSVQCHDTDRSFDALRRMLDADSCDSLFEATQGWGLIDHNLVAADVEGHIGHLVRAVVPRRPAMNGWLPMPGWTGDHDWDGMIPWEHMPRVDDPDCGYLATANNRIAWTIEGSGEYLCTDALPAYRVQRITELLAGFDRATPEQMTAIHRDDLTPVATVFQARLRSLHVTDVRQRQIRDLIVEWDGHMAGDSIAATHYARLRWALAGVVAERSGLATVAGDPLLALPPGTSPVSMLWWDLPGLLSTDRTGLLSGWDWDDALLAALDAMPTEDQPWADVHHARLGHPLSRHQPEIADRLSPEGAALGGDNDTVWANGTVAAGGTQAVYGAVARYVFDVGNWDACRWIVLAGTSGDPGSEHYLDQHAAWSRCELVPMHYDWEAIAMFPTSTRITP